MINDSGLLDIQLQIRDSRIIQIHIYIYLYTVVNYTVKLIALIIKIYV